MMSIRRLKSWLLALGLSCVPATIANAQVPPFIDGLPDDVQVFSQPDLNSFFSRQVENDGWFGGLESFLLTENGPAKVQIGLDQAVRQVYINNGVAGNPLLAGGTLDAPPISNVGVLFSPQFNSNDTGWLRSDLSGGARFDLGYVEEGFGWLVSAFNPITNTQQTTAFDANVVFDDFTNAAVVYSAFAGNAFVDDANGTSIRSTTPIRMPLLYGFVDQIGSVGANGLKSFAPDGYVDDINRNNVYGPDGRDRGTLTNTTIATATGTVLDGRPDPEGQNDVVVNPGGNNQGPEPGNPGTVAARTIQPIDYGDAVPLPVIFTEMSMRQKSTIGSIEANFMRRFDRLTPYGTTLDMLGGVRFIDMSDQFTVSGMGGVLGNSYWDTRAANRIVGPQLGIRFMRKRNRWSIGLEGRGVAAANFQTARQDGEIGSLLNEVPGVTNAAVTTGTVTAQGQSLNSATNPATDTSRTSGVAGRRLNQPLNLNRTAFNSSANMVTFAPVGELRANIGYQLFSSVSIQAGWTGLFADNLARSSNMIDYTLPRMGILANNNKQPLFMSAFNIGITVNR